MGRFDFDRWEDRAKVRLIKIGPGARFDFEINNLACGLANDTRETVAFGGSRLVRALRTLGYLASVRYGSAARRAPQGFLKLNVGVEIE